MNHKQLLMDFYLNLLAHTTDSEYIALKHEVIFSLGMLIEENPIELERILKKMASEDAHATQNMG